MKTLKQIKDEVAFRNFQKSWDVVLANCRQERYCSITRFLNLEDEVIEIYTEQETQILRNQLRENSEREARLLKQIELKQFYTKEQVVELLDDLKKELYKDVDLHSFNSNHSEERGLREAIARITNMIIHINTNDKIK